MNDDNTKTTARVDEQSSDCESYSYSRLNFALQTTEERRDWVMQMVNTLPPEKLTDTYLTKMADYILFVPDKAERKQLKQDKEIILDSHYTTLNARETSFQGLAESLENGEDGIYNMIANDKNIIFRPKGPKPADLADEIPALKTLMEEISKVEAEFKRSRGKKAAALLNQLKEMRKDQYVIIAAYRPTIHTFSLLRSASKINLDENISANLAEGTVTSDGLISLFNPHHISALLCHYSKLKEETWEAVSSDMHWLLVDLENLIDRTLQDDHPLLYSLLIYKIDGKSNAEIQSLLEKEYGIKHSIEYISSLWRNKIPKLIAETAAKDYLTWYYTNKERGKWKKCTRCGQIKLASNAFFSKNKTSKDGWYSICKECRNKKKEI